jgi:phage tail sheath protein FI
MRAVLPARPPLQSSISLAGSLNAAGVNPLMLQEGEPVIWGARTLSTRLP